MTKILGFVLGVFIVMWAPTLAADEPVRGLRMEIRAGMAQLAVRGAIEGAVRLLGNPDCQRLLTDFTDARGNHLVTNLQASGKSATDYLQALSFVDASGEEPCTKYDVIAAFPSARSRTIYVCGSRFENPYFGLNGPYGERVIIHEMLHSLGLEENPPTSRDITARVRQRCSR